jgi:hypothetical protein
MPARAENGRETHRDGGQIAAIKMRMRERICEKKALRREMEGVSQSHRSREAVFEQLWLR